MKRIISNALLSVLLLGLVSSCASQTDGDTDSETTSAPETTTAETESGLFSDMLSPVDFGGADFTILTINELSGTTLPTTLNYAESETGEVVNDTLFARDRWLEETYNVNVEYILSDESSAAFASQLVGSVMAGDYYYDACIMDVAVIAKTMLLNNCSYPINYIDTINIDADYWMPELNADMYIGDGLYFSASAISPRYYGSVYIYMFNTEMAEELQLENMYDLVKDGKCTLDKMFELSRLAVNDTDGNTIIDGNDRLGQLSDCVEGLIYSSGYKVLKNDGGELVCQLKDEGLIELCQKIAAFFMEDGIFDTTTKVFDSGAVLNNGNTLFYTPVTFNLADYRDLGWDYGILPFPKQNEAQEEYICYSQPWATATVVVPITLTGETLDRAGTLIDAMAAYGYDYVRPAVYENVLQMKGARDEESAEIIDLIFDNVTFELIVMFGGDSLNNLINNYFKHQLGEIDIVSSYAAIESQVEADIDATVSSITEFAATLK